MMISLLNNDNNKMHKTTITIMHFITHTKYIYIYSLTCSLLGIDKPDIMLPAENSFHIKDCTEDSTPIFPVKDLWWFVFSELVHEKHFKISHIRCTGLER